MTGAERISKPGQYSGYSAPLYDGHSLTSQYVAARDGTRLAVDIFRPTLNGKVVEDKLPVLWMHTPYNRRNYRNGLTVENYPGKALQLLTTWAARLAEPSHDQPRQRAAGDLDARNQSLILTMRAGCAARRASSNRCRLR